MHDPRRVGTALADDPVVLEAFGLGLVSALSLLLGCGVGLVRAPGPVLNAALMSFGGGALFFGSFFGFFGFGSSSSSGSPMSQNFPPVVVPTFFVDSP